MTHGRNNLPHYMVRYRARIERVNYKNNVLLYLTFENELSRIIYRYLKRDKKVQASL